MMNRISNYYGNYNNFSNSYFNSTNALNQLKLQQALDKLDKKTSSSSSNTATSSLSSNASTFLRNYDSAMSDLMSAANSLRDVNSSGVSNSLTVNSSDSDVLTASKNYTLRKPESFDVSVQQLAAAQQNVSTAVTSNAKATEDANFSIVTNKGTANINVSSVNEYGVQKTNRQLLNDVAKEINRQSVGVKASVETTKDGKSVLKLTSKETGTDNSFIVNGEFAKNNGLSEATTAAQNAQYSVTDSNGFTEEFTSSSNNVSLDYGKASMTLKSVGDATVSVGVDNKNIADAVENLVDKFNKALSVVSSNADRGSGVKNQLSQMLSGPAPEKSLKLIGITKNADGSLSLNKDTLLEKLDEDPELIKDIISGNHGLAQGAYRSAESGMSRSANSLISKDLKQMQQETSMDTLSLMSRFANSGAYNLSNYYTAEKESFMQGVFAMMFSQVLIKLLGLVYKMYLTNREGFGDEGNAIYSSGFYIYSLLLTLSSVGVPNAISKLVSERIALGDNKGANRIFKIAFFIFGILGFVGTMILFLGAHYISNVILKIPEAEMTLVALSPSIFFVALICVIRGYFNGNGTLKVTANSQTLEQIFKTVFTILLVELVVIATGINTTIMAAGANLATTVATIRKFYILIYFL